MTQVVAPVQGPGFNPQYQKNKNKEKNILLKIRKVNNICRRGFHNFCILKTNNNEY
jgi:hypothetical protein